MPSPNLRIPLASFAVGSQRDRRGPVPLGVAKPPQVSGGTAEPGTWDKAAPGGGRGCRSRCGPGSDRRRGATASLEQEKGNRHDRGAFKGAHVRTFTRIYARKIS